MPDMIAKLDFGSDSDEYNPEEDEISDSDREDDKLKAASKKLRSKAESLVNGSAEKVDNVSFPNQSILASKKRARESGDKYMLSAIQSLSSVYYKTGRHDNNMNYKFNATSLMCLGLLMQEYTQYLCTDWQTKRSEYKKGAEQTQQEKESTQRQDDTESTIQQRTVLDPIPQQSEDSASSLQQPEESSPSIQRQEIPNLTAEEGLE
ncbi:hypothetical protein DFQ28_002129 [Apophysomyces sp. BC1034]|nr:hypothetical protein DFQ29_001634 [Apophysomyces sp. BC1021]KAG0190385.1 hypothetical protein DFQ28_002129 [Apophysomyces sp. BC1034]